MQVADASGAPSNVQTQVARNDQYNDHDADDVENIHCALRFRLVRLQCEATVPSLKQTEVEERSSRDLATKAVKREEN